MDSTAELERCPECRGDGELCVWCKRRASRCACDDDVDDYFKCPICQGKGVMPMQEEETSNE